MGLCTSSAFTCSLTCPDLPSNPYPYTFILLGKYGNAGSLPASLLLIGVLKENREKLTYY